MNELKGLKNEGVGMQGMGTTSADPNAMNYAEYKVRYMKVSMDDPIAVSELENIETQSIDGSGSVVVLGKVSFTFMDQFFWIVTYIEKNTEFVKPGYKGPVMTEVKPDKDGGFFSV